ncbi:MAG: hypothetical protein JWN25_3667 [Verrucomicrobiales bacterium]|nr:hypothetical protein [Verrucomicrobiales bacterium]MDB6129573.1 hypothetical protein [Verrucomicrobiales bacterium]
MCKVFLFLALCFAFLITGCKTTYDVTYQDQGTKVKMRGIAKPVYDSKTDTYTIISPTGKKIIKDSGLVREIKPHQDESEISSGSFKK